MTDYDEAYRAAHRCRCCKKWLPVLRLAIDHEKRCAAEHGLLLEPRAAWPKNS